MHRSAYLPWLAGVSLHEQTGFLHTCGMDDRAPTIQQFDQKRKEMETQFSPPPIGPGPTLMPLDEQHTLRNAIVEEGSIPFFPEQHHRKRRKSRRPQNAASGPIYVTCDEMQPEPYPAPSPFTTRLKVVWVKHQWKSNYLQRLRQWGSSTWRNGTNWIEESVITPADPSSVEILDTYFGNLEHHGK